MSVPTTAAKPCLTGLPVEVTETFATLLDLPDLCSMRLASRELAVKASQGCFRGFFLEKEFDLDDSEQLEKFKRVTKPGRLGCLVQKLTFLRYHEPKNECTQSVRMGQNENALVDCLRNLKTNLTSESLIDLSLDVRTKMDLNSRVSPHRSMWDKRAWDTPNTPLSLNVKGSTRSLHRRNWKATWNLAMALYRETTAALYESELPVRRLSVFGDTENCSLGFDQLAAYPEQALPSTSLATLRNLSLSLSHSIDMRASNEEVTELAVSTPANHIHRLEAFLLLCPRLETLDLHFFSIWNTAEEERTNMLLQERRFFDHIAASLTFPNLTSCILRGISCRSIALQQFLETTPQLLHVEMIKTTLTDGEWRPFFDALSARKLKSLHLVDLSERGSVYFLGVPGKPKLAIAGQRHGTDELTRCGNDTALAIKYQVAHGRVLGSPAKNRAFAIDIWLYGPVPSNPRT